MAETQAPRGASGGPLRALMSLPVRRAMQAALAAQVGLAALLVASELGGSPFFVKTAVTPRETRPIEPGDQVRPYEPMIVPERAGRGPGEGAPIALPREMERLDFRAVELPEIGPALLLTGPIAPGDSDRFERELDAVGPKLGAVALHSPGGRIMEALRIGELVRERGLDTVVFAEAACVSACPLVLFAGVERLVSRVAWIGLHQSFYDQGASFVPSSLAVRDVQTLQGEVMAYTDRMGVDARVLVHALSTPPEDAYFLVEAELEDYRVATRVID